MTTPKVNAAGMMAVGAQEITSGKTKGKADGQSFMDIMNLADTSGNVNAGYAGQDVGAVKNPKDTAKAQYKDVKSSRPEEVKKEKPSDVNKDVNRDKVTTKAEDTSKTQKTAKTEDNTKQDREIVEAAEEVKGAIEEELQITDEEMDQILEILGLTTVDLLDPKVITDIVAQIKDVTPVDIVSNEELTDLVSSLQGEVREITSDLIQEMDITPEEFNKAVAEVKNEYEGVSPIPVETKDFDPKKVRDDDRSPNDTVRTPAEAVSVRPERAEDHQGRTERIPDEEGRREVNLDINVRNESAAQDNTGTSEGSSQDDLFRSQGRAERHTGGEAQNTTNNNIFFQNLTGAVENAIEAAEAQTPISGTTMVDAMDLIDQISSQVRAVIDNETQSLAMQLHPQSLGRLNVELVSKGGQVTAQFEAENASVRAALEGHIAELKETLEQRGLRVENVEVTIASHEFEQNLMGGQQSENTEQGSGRRPRTRRINLNDMEVEGIPDEDIDEGERIAREMMAADGNSVDFTA